MGKGLWLAGLLVGFVAFAGTPAPVRADIAHDSQALASGRTTSEALVRHYLRQIEARDRRGPRIHAVIALNPDALAQARRLDREAREGRRRGPLHGVPILIKDNIETADAMATTAGSLALADNVTGRDAPVVARLRAAGAIILGKANLSEWANIRSNRSISGWSAVGGSTANPFALDRNPCGSSAGSGAGVAAGFASAALGTETDGSIVCPAGVNGVVGFKPTLGLLPRRHIVPISQTYDTPGPMTATVADAALLMTVMAGTDPDDPATVEADARKVDYLAGLRADALAGRRIGLIYQEMADPVMMAAARARLEAAGAVVLDVRVNAAQLGPMFAARGQVLLSDLRADIARYLQGLPGADRFPQTLAGLIAFNQANATREMVLFGQETFLQAEAAISQGSPEYLEARARAAELAGPQGLDAMMKEAGVELLVAQTNGPAWLRATHGGGGGPSISSMPAIAGYPHLTVPMGLSANGLPVGLSIIGTKWADAQVLAAGFAFEQAGPPLRPRPTYRESAPRLAPVTAR